METHHTINCSTFLTLHWWIQMAEGAQGPTPIRDPIWVHFYALS